MIDRQRSRIIDQGELSEPFWVDLRVVPCPWGDLYFGQQSEQFPFPVERIYFVKDVPATASRGGHAHYRNREVIFCLQGACTLWLYNPRQDCFTFRLDDPSRGAFIPSGWWVELGEYESGSMTLVVSSLAFAEIDYIRDPKEFFSATPYPDTVYRSRP